MEEIIEINGKKIKAIKEKLTLYSATSQKEQLLYKMPKFVPKGRRIKYTLPIEIYKEIPEIVHIDNKRFLKGDYIIKSKYFNLIEC